MRLARSTIGGLFGASFVLLAPSAAEANGRFPGARQVVVAPSAPSTVLLRTTFGQMLTHDGGQSFRWLCEQAIGYGGTQDPAVGITLDGTLLNAAYEGTSVSRDGGCSFPFPPGLGGRYSTDLTVDASSPSRALIIVAADASKQPELPAQLWETRDDGKSFAVLSALPKGFFPQNVDIARSSPQRVYVTGLQAISGKSQPSLLRSDDGGVSWVQRDVPAVDANVYLSAVDPLDEKRIYVRVESDPDDELLLSTDAGESYTSLSKLAGGMLGFALSPDGSRIAIGGPTGGVRVATRAEGVFVEASTTPVTCLAWGTDGLYGCGVDELSSGFALGLSKDEGKTFTPVLAALGDVCGPLPSSTCGAATPYAQACPGRWPAVLATLRTTTGAPAACTVSGGGNAGGTTGNVGGAAGAAGLGGAGAGAAAGGSSAETPTPSRPASDPSCQCALPGAAARSGPPAAWAAFLLAALARVGQRRQRRVSG